ncbi:hypothetical protein E1B28_013336 [Marasmius oreades]|uniref:Uncharacterized protein n=1 Tax=Marasmius oreades TaxID=181124 RepID=A0A9P7UML4_9AGAR|nr:uncharacterized protein E1B28_013336 [Marasmius oreades]KAG7087363.1 hypothetical protein E1B28_013336 [Marasmius oreades]
MALSFPRSVVNSSRAGIPQASAIARRPPNVFITPSLTTPSLSEPQTDQHIILTRKRHSDFNPHAIQNDHRHAGQFLRWKEWNLKNQSMLKTKMIKTGDILVAGAATDIAYTHTAQASTLLDSRIFKIQLLDPLDSPDCLGFRCRLISIGDTVLPHTPSATSKFIVKLYDDRFFPSPSLDQGSIWYKPGDNHSSAEDYIRSELVAYNQQQRGRSRCHGAFKFVLSRNGHWLNGLLVEEA